MVTEDIIKTLAERAKLNNPAAPDDYIGEDGLLHCGVCREPKECALDIEGNTLVVRCLCSCGIRRRKEAAEAEYKRQNEDRRHDWLRGYENMTFENAKDTPAMEKAKRYAALWDKALESGLSFTLVGGVGCGKTYAAAAIANDVLDKGYRVWMATTAEMISRMYSEADKINNRLDSFELVVLDDFGAERETEYAGEKMFQIIDRRMNSGLPTIVTTNLNTAKPAPNTTYERIFSRLNGSAPPVLCRGEDLRAAKGKAKQDLMRELLKGGAP